MKCENCNCNHDGTYGSGRFCSCKCARSFSTKNKRYEINKKVSKKLKLLKSKTIRKPKLCKKCNQDICKEPKLCNSFFFSNQSNVIQKFGFDKTTIGTDQFYNECVKLKKFIFDLYYTFNKSLKDIQKEFGVHSLKSIQRLFNLFDIERRTISDSNFNAILNKGLGLKCNPKYKSGYHKSWDNQLFFYRSSYELKYMEKLDNKKIKYEYEKIRIKYFDTIKNNWRIAIPDFYLPDYNMLVEIKSTFTYNKQNMIDKSNEYKKLGFNFKLILNFEEYDYCV